MAIKVYNDNLLVELAKSQWAIAKDDSEQDDPNAGHGVVVGIPDQDDVYYLSSYSWMAENTLDSESQAQLHRRMTKLLGKKVYFDKRSEIGNCIEDGDITVATIRLSKIIAVEE